MSAAAPLWGATADVVCVNVFLLLLIEEAGLLVLDAQLAVYGGDDALHLSKCEHTSEERVACIVALRLVAQHCHSVVNAHWKWFLAALLFLFKDAGELDDVCTPAQMACLCEVAVGEDVA